MTKSLDSGWYAVVFVCWMLNRLHKAAYREEVNWVPRSDVMIALGQREVLSTILNKWVKPRDT